MAKDNYSTVLLKNIGLVSQEYEQTVTNICLTKTQLMKIYGGQPRTRFCVQHASQKISRKWFVQQPMCTHMETKACINMHKSERFWWIF